MWKLLNLTKISCQTFIKIWANWILVENAVQPSTLPICPERLQGNNFENIANINLEKEALTHYPNSIIKKLLAILRLYQFVQYHSVMSEEVHIYTNDNIEFSK